MLILSRPTIETLLTMPATIAAVEEGFGLLARGQVTMPQRAATVIAPHEGLHLSMPAFVAGDPGTLTIKIVTVYGQNLPRFGLPTIQGVILLHDARNGKLLALLDAEHITAMRTGAASGVATKYLARPEAATVTLFGAGAQAGPQLESVCAVRPIRQAYVVTRTGKNDAAFCAEMSAKLDIPVTPSRDPRQAVAAADVICLATDAAGPVIESDWLKPGTHINAVGAFTAKMREVDSATIQRSRVFVDHHSAARVEAGDILIPLANGEISESHIAGSLGELINGQVTGRTSPEEITFFKSVGLAMQDAVTVARVYALAVEQAIGQEIDW